VMLDTMRQIETYLLQSNYEGFLKKGRIGSLPVPQPGLRNGAEESALGSMPKICLTLFFFGVAAWVANHWESFVK